VGRKKGREMERKVDGKQGENRKENMTGFIILI
jgi:hypothetical protein